MNQINENAKRLRFDVETLIIATCGLLIYFSSLLRFDVETLIIATVSFQKQ